MSIPRQRYRYPANIGNASIVKTSICSLIAICCMHITFSSSTTAQQQVVIQTPDGQMVTQVVEGGPPGMPPPNGVPGQPGKPPGPPSKDGKPGEPAAADKKPGVEPVLRKAPPEAPNKREFDVKPDEDGMLQFQFRNQAWPDLMRWLAEVSGMSLDWQELPGDYLNIATQRKHSLDEARDLFNRHLLARGFTMLEYDGTIQIIKTKEINAALVPKVDPIKLASLPANRFVRTSFSLDTLVAAEVLTELKPLISTNGTLNALASTNRLEAMDTAANLSELYRILSEEQSADAQQNLAREFVLRHVRATECREQLLAFLGIESKDKKAPTSSRDQQQMMMEMQQQMMQQQQQQQQGGAAKQKPKSEIYIVANVRRNSVIAHAAADKMAIIAAFVNRVDVPNDTSSSLQALQARTKVYRLTALDPKQLISSLVAMDALEPTTKLEVDDKNKAIIAHASISDHYTIQEMIKRLDGSARDVEVIQLRRLRAEDVAGTIKFLMGTEDKKDNQSSRRNFFYYDPWGNNNNKEESSKDAFRVAANAQDNQVLIWANEIEREEVMKLLVKLGELPPEGGSSSRIRVIDANRSSDTKEYLKRLQEAWSKVSPTPLELPSDEEFEKDMKKSPASEPATPPTTEEPSKTTKEVALEKEKTVSSVDVPHENLRRLGIPAGKLSMATFQPPANGSNATETNDDVEVVSVPSVKNTDLSPTKSAPARQPSSSTRASASKPPIKLSFDERGNLVLVSDDTEALSKLEQMMLENAPPKRGYEVFVIKHSTPSWIKWNLEDYYKEDKKDREQDTVFRWLFDMEPSKKENEDPQLGKKRKLRFLSDNDTNSLIVIGADDVQLKTIEGLIRLWDVPEKTNKQRLRFSKLVKVEFSKAQVVADVIKEAYRDLLSSNDKAFEKGKEGGGGGGGGGKDAKRDSSSDQIFEGGMNFSFSGRLSLGVDTVTNSIIVSAQGDDLLQLVCKMIDDLDKAAMPSESVEILKLDGSNSTAMEKALTAWMRANNAQAAAEADPNQAQNQPGQPNLNGVAPNVNNSKSSSRKKK